MRKFKKNGRKESGGKIMIKANKIRKRVKKEKTVFLTALPEKETIKWDELIGYCRENMIPRTKHDDTNNENKEIIKDKEAQMREAAQKLEFELAAILRDEIRELTAKEKVTKKK